MASGSRGTSVGLTLSLTTSPVTTTLAMSSRDGHVVHHVEEHLLDDRAQAAGAGAAHHGLVGDRLDGVGGELELDAVELEELLVLLDQRVAGLGEDLDQRLAVELVDASRSPAAGR